MSRQATPAQSKRLAGTRVSPANGPRLRRVQYAGEQRVRTTIASLPPATRVNRATGQAATAVLQGASSGSEPDATIGWVNPQASVLSRHHRLRAVADVEAAPIHTGRPVKAAPQAGMPRQPSRRGSPDRTVALVCVPRQSWPPQSKTRRASPGLVEPPVGELRTSEGTGMRHRRDGHVPTFQRNSSVWLVPPAAYKVAAQAALQA